MLKQIDEPHAYYFREMYLPQLTTGPSAVAWSPDSKSVVYSMAGSLWLQKIDSDEAQQLTAGPGYDYQPDWSSDGHWIVYAKYDKSAIELWALDLESKQAHALTNEGAVNVEPRFSPDGKRIAFVSTTYNGRFHIFVGRFEAGTLSTCSDSRARTAVHFLVITTARSITRSVRRGLLMGRNCCSFRIVATSTGPAGSGG